jgi:hypothetical protein
MGNKGMKDFQVPQEAIGHMLKQSPFAGG